MVAPLRGSQTHSDGEMIRQDQPLLDVIYEPCLGQSFIWFAIGIDEPGAKRLAIRVGDLSP